MVRAGVVTRMPRSVRTSVARNPGCRWTRSPGRARPPAVGTTTSIRFGTPRRRSQNAAAEAYPSAASGPPASTAAIHRPLTPRIGWPTAYTPAWTRCNRPAASRRSTALLWSPSASSCRRATTPCCRSARAASSCSTEIPRISGVLRRAAAIPAGLRRSRHSGPPFLRRFSAGRRASRAQRELARAGAEAHLDEQRLPRGPDHRLAVDALERQAAGAVAGHERGERLERRPHPRVVGLDEEREAAAAALDVDGRLGAGEDDVGAGDALGLARLGVALGPRQRRTVRLGRIGRGQDHRRLALAVAGRPQPLDRAGERELRAPEPLDEVAAPARAERLELRERVVEDREAAGDALGEDLLAADDAVALKQQLGERAAALAGVRLAAEDRAGQGPAPLDLRLRAGPPRGEAPAD